MYELEENWKKLPQELHRHVLSYTYSPQPKDLLDDIRNFHTSLHVIKEIYRCNKTIFAGEDNAPTWVEDWIINDLYGWLNDDMAVMHGFREKFVNLIQRNPYYSLFARRWAEPNAARRPQGYCPTEKIILLLGMKSGESELRIFWGLLNPNQRQKFILDRLYVVDTDDSVPMEIDG